MMALAGAETERWPLSLTVAAAWKPTSACADNWRGVPASQISAQAEAQRPRSRMKVDSRRYRMIRPISSAGRTEPPGLSSTMRARGA